MRGVWREVSYTQIKAKSGVPLYYGNMWFGYSYFSITYLDTLGFVWREPLDRFTCHVVKNKVREFYKHECARFKST